MRLLPWVEKFLTSDMRFENSAQFRKILLINSILFFATIIFLFFGIYNVLRSSIVIALFDFVAAAVMAGAIIDLRLNKNVTRAGNVGIWGLFAFFLVFVTVNEGNDFGLIWTIFFPIFTIMIREKKGIPVILLYYGILFILAFVNIGVWQNGEWSTVGFVRLVAASLLITYVVYVSEQARLQADSKNDELLRREKEYSTQLHDYQLQLESKVQKTLTALSEKERIILRNSQLAEMGNMIGVIAHQLKQPLNAINIMSYGIKDAYQYNELSDEYLTETTRGINKQVQHMSATIDDFRDFFNPNKKKKIFNVAQAVEKTLELLLPQLTKNAIVVDRKLAHDIEVLGYESEFQQVLINLIHNAKDVFEERGVLNPRITVTCRLDPQKDVPIVRIDDNGGGVPDTIREKIFDSYFTTKAEEGTGIGLYLVRKIIEESFEGSVTVHNTDGGARFTLYLGGASVY